MSTFHLFVYGTLRAQQQGAALMRDCERVGRGTVHGTVYDIDGRFPALLLYGDTPVPGEIWRCPADALLRLDEYEGVAEHLFRRIAHEVRDDDTGQPYPCWLYVAGPALARRLTPDRRVDGAVAVREAEDEDALDDDDEVGKM